MIQLFQADGSEMYEQRKKERPRLLRSLHFVTQFGMELSASETSEQEERQAKPDSGRKLGNALSND